VAPDPDSLDSLWAVDPYSDEFQPAAERFLCSQRDLPDVGYSSRPSAATLLVQWVLNRYYFHQLDLDGRYGPASRTAVKDFQERRWLEVDGLVGPITWSRLRKGACDD